MRVLVTGAAGSIGRVVTAGLTARGHDVVGMDLLPPPEGYGGSWHTADCADPDAVADACAAQPLEAVVHLAGHPGEASLPDSLTSHVLTTAALLDAMVAQGMSRIVYASSNHAVGRTPRHGLETGLLTDAAPPRPDTFYGVGKVAAEALVRLYADRHAVDAVACRIGSFLPQPETVRHLSTWLSHDDAVRMVEAALTAPSPGFAVIYGISANTRRWWDLAPGHALGYHPRDDAEGYAGQVPVSAADQAEGAYVGGPFATDAFERPAFDPA